MSTDFCFGPAEEGYSDPLDRDPARVLDDVLDGYISAETAEQDYGVVIATGNRVDEVATVAACGSRWG